MSSSLTNQFELNEEIFISSNIEFSSVEIFSINSQWIIYNISLNSSILIQLDNSIKTKSSEIYIPSKKLTYGIYQFKLTVNLIGYLSLTVSKSINIQIIRSSKIIVNLLQFQLSKIRFEQNKDLIFQPGIYSFDMDGNQLIENVCICN